MNVFAEMVAEMQEPAQTASNATRHEPLPPMQKTAGKTLYETDFVAWLQQQSELLRGQDFARLDIANLVEELEDMGRSEIAALQSAIEQALLHLIKLEFSPAEDPRKSWQVSVLKQRVAIEKLLKKNPGLQSRLPELHADAWLDARKIAIAEMAVYGEHPSVPQACPYSIVNVRDENFWPQQAASGSNRMRP